MILIVSRFGFEGWIWDLIASVPVLRIPSTFSNSNSFTRYRDTTNYVSTQLLPFHIIRMYTTQNLIRANQCKFPLQNIHANLESVFSSTLHVKRRTCLAEKDILVKQ